MKWVFVKVFRFIVLERWLSKHDEVSSLNPSKHHWWC